MSGSGMNRLVISSYTFGPSCDGLLRPRVTLTSKWVAFPALATLGAVSVAAISLSPAVSDKSLTAVQTISSQDRSRVGVEGSSAQDLHPMLQVVTSASQPTPQLTVEGVPKGEHADVRQEKRFASETPLPAKFEGIAAASRIDAGQLSESSARTFGGTRVATAPIELLQPSAGSEECAPSCDSNRLALNAVHDESTLYSPDRPFSDVHVTMQSPTLVSDASSLKTEQPALLAIVEPQSALTFSEDVEFAAEALVGQRENSPAGGVNELELTLADAIAVPDASETSALVAAESEQTPVEQPAGVRKALTADALAVREHLARIDARYADKTIAARAVPDIAADESGQLAEDVEEISVLVAPGATQLGSASMVIAEDQLVSVRLGDLISLFQDKLERPLFVWMSNSNAATRFVTPETLAAAGLNVHFDPERRQLVLGVGD